VGTATLQFTGHCGGDGGSRVVIVLVVVVVVAKGKGVLIRLHFRT